MTLYPLGSSILSQPIHMAQVILSHFYILFSGLPIFHVAKDLHITTPEYQNTQNTQNLTSVEPQPKGATKLSITFPSSPCLQFQLRKRISNVKISAIIMQYQCTLSFKEASSCTPGPHVDPSPSPAPRQCLIPFLEQPWCST